MCVITKTHSELTESFVGAGGLFNMQLCGMGVLQLFSKIWYVYGSIAIIPRTNKTYTPTAGSPLVFLRVAVFLNMILYVKNKSEGTFVL